MPTLEPDSTGLATPQTREAGGDSDSPLLAVSSMVPIGTGDVHLSTGSGPKVLCASSSRKRKSYPSEEPSLALRGLESKRARLIREGVSKQAIDFISNNSTAVKTSQRIRPAQQEFQQWLQDGSFEQGISPPSSL